MGSNMALRLPASLLEEAKRVPGAEGVALKQFINMAIAEKVSALRTEDYFVSGASGPIEKAKRILGRAVRRGKAPCVGDEIQAVSEGKS